MNRLTALLPLLFVALFTSAASAYGQTSFEVTPLFGGRFGGSLNLGQEGQTNRLGSLDDSFSFGVAAGFRFDGDDCESCSVIDFRWMRQSTHLGFEENAPNVAPFRTPVTFNHFLGDFTREFPIGGTQDRVKPFVTASLGAVHMSTAVGEPPEVRVRCRRWRQRISQAPVGIPVSGGVPANSQAR